MNRFRRRRIDRAFLDKLTADNHQLRYDLARLTSHTAAVERENDAQRAALADLGRQLHAAQTGPLGDTAPLPRVRSLTPGPSIDLTRAGDETELLVLPFPPAHWKST